MKNLESLLAEIESKISQQSALNKSVSEGSVGWHIEHILLVINGIISRLKRSNPEEFKGAFNMKRLIVFTTGIIPRGKAKAPESVVPKTFDTESLTAHIAIAKERIKQLDDMNPHFFMEHPVFGHLKKEDTVKFLRIHTNHHLKIINDILK